MVVFSPGSDSFVRLAAGASSLDGTKGQFKVDGIVSSLNAHLLVSSRSGCGRSLLVLEDQMMNLETRTPSILPVYPARVP